MPLVLLYRLGVGGPAAEDGVAFRAVAGIVGGRAAEGDGHAVAVDVEDLQERVHFSAEGDLVVDRFDPVVLADGGTVVAAEGLELHGGAFDRCTHGVDDGGVVGGPLEGDGARFGAVDLDAVEAVLRAAIARLGGDGAWVVVRVDDRPRLEARAAAQQEVRGPGSSGSYGSMSRSAARSSTGLAGIERTCQHHHRAAGRVGAEERDLADRVVFRGGDVPLPDGEVEQLLIAILGVDDGGPERVGVLVDRQPVAEFLLRGGIADDVPEVGLRHVHAADAVDVVVAPGDAERNLVVALFGRQDHEPVAGAAVRADHVRAEAAQKPQQRLGLFVGVGVELHASHLLEHARDAVAVLGGVQ